MSIKITLEMIKSGNLTEDMRQWDREELARRRYSRMQVPSSTSKDQN